MNIKSQLNSDKRLGCLSVVLLEVSDVYILPQARGVGF